MGVKKNKTIVIIIIASNTNGTITALLSALYTFLTIKSVIIFIVQMQRLGFVKVK